MAKLSFVLGKLKKANIQVEKQSYEANDFYYFSIDGKTFSFINCPQTGDKVSCLCREFDNGANPSFYSSIAQLLRMHGK